MYHPLNSTLQQLPFQQTYPLFLEWLLIAQTQYRNMDKGCKEIHLQGKKLCNSWKLRKVVAIYKKNKLAFSKKYISLKTRSLEKVPYSKSSCSRLASGIAFSNDKYRRKNSHGIPVSSCCWTHSTTHVRSAQICTSCIYNPVLLKNQPHTPCLTDFYFYGTVFKQNDIWRSWR